MNKIFTLFPTLLSIFSFSQSTVEAQLFDIGKKGNSEMKNLKVSENQLFFTGKEFFYTNFARYNFDANKFVTFNTNKVNYNLESENIAYAIVKNEVFYVVKENNYVEIKKGLENGTVETFFETPTRISNFKQFGKDKFIFTSAHYKTSNSIFERLWISDGTKDGTKNIFESESTYSNINFIDKVGDKFYFSSGNKTYSLDFNTHEIKEFFTSLYNPLIVFKNKIHYFNYNYQTKEQELYIINDANSSEKVASLSNDNIGNNFKYHVVGDNVYIYTNINSTFYVDSFLYEYNSQKQTIKKIFDKPVREVENIFDYNGVFYFSTYTEDSKYFNYKIEDDAVLEMNYFIKDNAIYNPIVFEDKLFMANNGKISYYNFLTKELTYVNNENYQTIYYTYFKNPFIYNNELYFVSSDELNDEELFKYNKDKNTKEVVFNYNSSQGSSPYGFSKIKNNVLFFANENILHQYNSENKKFEVIFDENDNFIKSVGSFNKVEKINDKSIAFVTDSLELGISDGTKQGTFIYQKRGSNENYLMTNTTFIPFNNKIVFTGTTKYKGEEPWVTDGTREGTYMLKDVYDGYESSSPSLYPNGYTILNKKLYFSANTIGVYSTSIFETDGTKEGTKEILKFNNSYYSNNLRIYGNFDNRLIVKLDKEFYLLNINNLEKTKLTTGYSPEYFFEYNNKLYCSEYNDLYYFDNNYNAVKIKSEQSINLKPLTIINNEQYLYSKTNGYVYKLKDDKITEITNDYLSIREELEKFKIVDENIFYITNSVDNYYSSILKRINKDGVSSYKINFENEDEEYLADHYIIDYKIVNGKIYMDKVNKKYGSELYIIDLPTEILSNEEIKTINIKNNFTLYPNPSSDYFKVRTKNNDNLSITIFDINGTKIKNVNVKSESEIKINNLPKGIYIIHIDNGIQKENKKLIIK